MKQPKRCAWVTDAPIYIEYHDEEWGVPVYDDQRLFEFLILEGAQAGLSWLTILKKRDNYRSNFKNFDIKKVARFNSHSAEKLMLDPGIVRNRRKIEATIINAKMSLKLIEEFGSLSYYFWQYVGGEPQQNHWLCLKEVPATSEVSDAMAKDLKKRGFKFVGSTICYAFMQAVGMVNDHTTDCFRYKMNLGSPEK